MTGSPILRSMLFVPVLRERFIASALAKPVPAVILDLEDSIPPEQKDLASEALPSAVQRLQSAGIRTLVRVNRHDSRDLTVCARTLPWGIIVPKVDGPKDLRIYREAFRSLAQRPKLFAIVESAAGLIRAAATARQDFLDGLMFGASDFVHDTNIAPDIDVLSIPAIHVVLAARAARIPAYGLAGLISEYGDAGALRRLAIRSKALGFSGTPVVHPSQIPVIEEIFAPTSAELSRARQIVEQYEAGDGLPVRIAGELVEWPIYQAACNLLGR